MEEAYIDSRLKIHEIILRKMAKIGKNINWVKITWNEPDFNKKKKNKRMEKEMVVQSYVKPTFMGGECSPCAYIKVDLRKKKKENKNATKLQFPSFIFHNFF